MTTPKFKMTIKLADGTERDERVRDCSCLAGATFEAENTIRFHNMFNPAEQHRELVRVYQVDEETINEQNAKKKSDIMASNRAIMSNSVGSSTNSSGGSRKTKNPESKGTTNADIIAPIQRKLF